MEQFGQRAAVRPGVRAWLAAQLAALPVLMQNQMVQAAYTFAEAYASAVTAIAAWAIGRWAPYDQYFRWMEALDGYYSLLFEVSAYPFFVLLPFAVFAAARGISLREARGGGRASPGLCAATAACALGLSVPAQYMAMIISTLLERFGLYEGAYNSVVAFDGVSLVLILLSVCVLPPLFEEYAYRGVLFAETSRFGGTRAAILVSALFFALMHESLMTLPNALLFGLFVGWVRGRYECVTPCVIGHCAVNLAAVGYETAAAYLPGRLYGQTVFAADGVCLVLGLFGALYFIFDLRRDRAGIAGNFYEGALAPRRALLLYAGAVTTVLLLVQCVVGMTEGLWPL